MTTDRKPTDLQLTLILMLAVRWFVVSFRWSVDLFQVFYPSL